MDDDPHGNWFDFIMTGENATKRNSGFFDQIGKNFTLKDAFLKTINDYKHNELKSVESKNNNTFIDEMNFDQHVSQKR